ncbi:MAG: Omp28-related outer membrane protein [Flavobacteriales bacterium]|nr:Omp28-related outer membrane protein [Flavobacteriales bacterium]
MLRSLLMASLFTTAAAAGAQDAYLTNYYIPRFIRTGSTNSIDVRVRNFSSSPLFTFRVDWRWGNGAVNEGFWQNTTGITGNQYWPYTHPTAFAPVTAGTGMLKIWVVTFGETNPANDTLFFPVSAISQWSEKAVLLDAWTGTWCPYCPPANTMGNLLNTDPHIVVAKHHAADEYSSPSSTQYFNQYNVTYTPAGVLDQGEYGMYAPNPDHDQWDAQTQARLQGVSPVSISVNATVNEWTRDLTVTVTANFQTAFNGDFTLNAYLLEDNMSGTQNNAPANYMHEQIVRDVMGGTLGVPSAVPSAPVAGTNYSHTFTRSVPAEWNISNLRVVGYITHRQGATAYTLNVAKGGLLPVGVPEGMTRNALCRIAPNPIVDHFTVDVPDMTGQATLTVIAADGRAVLEQQVVLMPGASLQVADVVKLPAGTYQVRIATASEERHGRVVKLN